MTDLKRRDRPSTLVVAPPGAVAGPPDPAGQEPPDTDQARADIHRITYGYLRWLMICLPALLFGVTVATAIQQGELEASISAYYGGPVRDIFVGCLVAVAACLVAYQGVGLLEDYTLNGAGFYAVFVALVPTGFAQLMADLRENPSPDGFLAEDHVWFLRIAFVGVLSLCVVLFGKELRAGNVTKLLVPRTGGRRTDVVNQLFVAITVLLLVGFLGLVAWQLARPADQVTLEGLDLGAVQLRVHDIAAILLIGSLVVAVLTNTWPFYRFRTLWGSGRYSYLVIVLLMTLGAVVPIGVARLFAPGHGVIFLEWWEILLFMAFWLLETYRLRRGQAGTLPSVPEQGPLVEPRRALGPAQRTAVTEPEVSTTS